MTVLSLLKRLLSRTSEDEDPAVRGRRAISDMRSSAARSSGWLVTGGCDGHVDGVRDAGGKGGAGGDDGC